MVRTPGPPYADASGRRVERFSVPLTTSEKAEIVAAAMRREMTPVGWAREVLLIVARSEARNAV